MGNLRRHRIVFAFIVKRFSRFSCAASPEDGSNWELLCLFCHDHEHSKYTEADQYGTTVVAGEDAQKDVGVATFNPFADLKAMMNKKT